MLCDKSVSARTLLRLSYIDFFEEEHRTYVGDRSRFTAADSLASWYIGYRCETEVTGFVECAGFGVYTVSDWLFFITFLLLVGVFLPISIHYIPMLLKHYFPEKNVVYVKEELPIVFAEERNTPSVKFKDGVVFDVAHIRIGRVGNMVNIPPQTARLFHAFLKAEDYKLSMKEIHDILWPGQGESPDRIYNAIRRLRASLSEHTHWGIGHAGDYYWLKYEEPEEEQGD